MWWLHSHISIPIPKYCITRIQEVGKLNVPAPFPSKNHPVLGLLSSKSGWNLHYWETAARDLSPFPYSSHSLPVQDIWWIMWFLTLQFYTTLGKTEILPGQSCNTEITFTDMKGKTEITNKQLCKQENIQRGTEVRLWHCITCFVTAHPHFQTITNKCARYFPIPFNL